MKLEVGEYTTQGFLDFLIETYKTKVNGEAFTSNDVAQYLRRGYTPYRYGNLKISASTQHGIRIIKVKQEDKSKVKK